MATQFHEGQDIEVHQLLGKPGIQGAHGYAWRKAKIVGLAGEPYPKNSWEIQFQDGFHAVFDAEHIRALRQGVYGEWCYDPNLCADKGYCPRDPTCAD